MGIRIATVDKAMWGVGFSYGDGFGVMWGVNEVERDRLSYMCQTFSNIDAHIEGERMVYDGAIVEIPKTPVITFSEFIGLNHMVMIADIEDKYQGPVIRCTTLHATQDPQRILRFHFSREINTFHRLLSSELEDIERTCKYGDSDGCTSDDPILILEILSRRFILRWNLLNQRSVTPRIGGYSTITRAKCKAMFIAPSFIVNFCFISGSSSKDGDGDTSFQWSQFITPCSHLIFLFNDIMTTERPTTQLPQL
ncbi:hypothetical protein Tco_1285031 [Tanacetum coccineum]